MLYSVRLHRVLHSGPRSSFYCLGHFKNVHDDDDDDDDRVGGWFKSMIFALYNMRTAPIEKKTKEGSRIVYYAHGVWIVASHKPEGRGSVAEWLVCWTQAQKTWVQIAVATLSDNSLGKLFTPIVPLFTKQQNW